MTSIFHSGDLSLILNNADVIIQVGENHNTKEFRAHSVILRDRSLYFKAAFSADWITKKNNMFMFNKPNITPTVFDMILQYIYNCELDLTKQAGEDILGLLVASDELLLDELFKHVQDYLVEKQTIWIQENFSLVLHTVSKLISCKKLQDYCLESICEDSRPFIVSKTFSPLDKDILFRLLKRDDLQIVEADIWDYLIKWGIEQTSDLGNKKSKWNKENYEALKKTLDQFIPLIRFIDIPFNDFCDRVRPYKAVIPHHIYKEAIKYHYEKILPKIATLPPRVGKLASMIIKSKHASIISNWIDKNDSTVLSSNNNYKFNLIYSMSRDGRDCTTFYRKCYMQGSLVVLIRVQSKKIFGGYNPIGYASRQGQCLPSTESFIFSFENDHDTHNMKIGRVINESNSLHYLKYAYFFNFGCYLYIDEKSLIVGNNTHHYSSIINRRTDYPFEEIEEIEVFSVVKR